MLPLIFVEFPGESRVLQMGECEDKEIKWPNSSEICKGRTDRFEENRRELGDILERLAAAEQRLEERRERRAMEQEGGKMKGVFYVIAVLDSFYSLVFFFFVLAARRSSLSLFSYYLGVVMVVGSVVNDSFGILCTSRDWTKGLLAYIFFSLCLFVANIFLGYNASLAIRIILIVFAFKLRSEILSEERQFEVSFNDQYYANEAHYDNLQEFFEADNEQSLNVEAQPEVVVPREEVPVPQHNPAINEEQSN